MSDGGVAYITMGRSLQNFWLDTPRRSGGDGRRLTLDIKLSYKKCELAVYKLLHCFTGYRSVMGGGVADITTGRSQPNSWLFTPRRSGTWLLSLLARISSTGLVRNIPSTQTGSGMNP